MWTYVTTFIVVLPLLDGLTGASDLVLSGELQALLQEWFPLIGAVSAYSLMWLITRRWSLEAASKEAPGQVEEQEEEQQQVGAPLSPKNVEKSTRAPSPPAEEEDTQYPDGFVFASNYVNSSEDLEKLRRETTQSAMRELFRSEEWRAHLRERGREESAYNWQRRQSLSSSDSRTCH